MPNAKERYTVQRRFAEMLDLLPTVHSGHTANCKIDTTERGGTLKVWLERGWREYTYDECPQPVTIECNIDGVWIGVTDRWENGTFVFDRREELES